jgi:hypothetical protein
MATKTKNARRITLRTIRGDGGHRVRVSAVWNEGGINYFDYSRSPKGYAMQLTVFETDGTFERMELGTCTFGFILCTADRFNAKKLALYGSDYNLIQSGQESWAKLLQRNPGKGFPEWDTLVASIKAEHNQTTEIAS